MTVFKLNHESINLGEEIASGGEGIVYQYNENFVVKIFREPKGKEAKLKCLEAKHISIPGICVPTELLYDSEGNFIGYVMERAFGQSMQNTIFQPQDFLQEFPGWTRVELCILALEILKKINALHQKEIILGDINGYNINVVNYDKVYFVDTDSYQVDNYSCPVGTIEYTAPEIQDRSFCSFLRTPYHEYFAIATLLFKIFMTGKNPYSRIGGEDVKENITRQYFAYPLGDEDGNYVPKGVWEAMWFDLNYDVRKAFYETFKNNNRYSIDQWVHVLECYLEELKSYTCPIQIFPLDSEFLVHNRTINMNKRDISEKDAELRNIETHLTSVYPPRKIAVLELSTKAVKLLYCNDTSKLLSGEFDFQLFHRESTKTNTGRGLDKDNRMDMAFFRSKVLFFIRKYKQQAIKDGVDCLYTVATAAYRGASNRDEIIRCIREEANINVQILMKKEEAIATICAFAFSTHNRFELHNHEYVMMIDQGGGSTEVSLFKDLQDEPIAAYSMNLGTEVLRTLLFRGAHNQTPLIQSLRNADKLIRDRLDALYKNIENTFPKNSDIYCVAVGTAITKATGGKKNKDQHDRVLTLENLKEKIAKLNNELLDNYTYVGDLYSEINENESLDAKVVMRVGLQMFVTMMKHFGISQLTVSGTGLWYGIFFQHLHLNK